MTGAFPAPNNIGKRLFPYREILSAVIKGRFALNGFHPPRRHPPAGATRFIEQCHTMLGLHQHFGAG